MKIAIISDIHSNIKALEAVLKDIKDRKCDAILCLGDFVGYYYWPEEVVNSLMNIENVYSIKGNHEEMLFASLKDLKVRENINNKYGLGIDYSCEKLSDTSLSFLENLESSMDLILDGISIGMFHGSPTSIDKYIYPDANQETFFDITNNKFNVVLFGHTHHQFVSYFNNTLIINPGSVGQSRDIRGLAAYSIYSTDSGVVLPLRIKYDTSSLVSKIKEIEKKAEKMLIAIQGIVS